MTKTAQLIGITILFGLCLYAIYFLWELLTDPNTLFKLMQVGIVLAVLFVIWMNTIGRKSGK